MDSWDQPQSDTSNLHFRMDHKNKGDEGSGTLGMLIVLVLGGVELIFFTVASMGLCFGFVLGTVLIIQGCFHYC